MVGAKDAKERVVETLSLSGRKSADEVGLCTLARQNKE